MSRSSRESAGFSLVEMVVAVTIISIAVSMTLAIHARLMRREELNATAVGLAGWLEEVRRAALKGNPCSVTIPATSGAGIGTNLATAVEVPLSGAAARPERCQANSPFTVPSALNAFRVAVSPAQSFTFGALGTVNPSTDKEMVLSLLNPAGQVELRRCVRLRGMLGFLEVGNHTGSSCSYPSRY
jgi:prepilin-type N-terminal cleavage/methylation domain-containing protein